jgi:hypothetical protein
MAEIALPSERYEFFGPLPESCLPSQGEGEAGHASMVTLGPKPIRDWSHVFHLESDN